MSFKRDYKCTECNARPGRDNLKVKKVQFVAIGVRPKVFRSRTVAWLCPDCIKKDPAWNQLEYDSPGLQPREEQEVN